MAVPDHVDKAGIFHDCGEGNFKGLRADVDCGGGFCRCLIRGVLPSIVQSPRHPGDWRPETGHQWDLSEDVLGRKTRIEICAVTDWKFIAYLGRICRDGKHSECLSWKLGIWAFLIATVKINSFEFRFRSVRFVVCLASRLLIYSLQQQIMQGVHATRLERSRSTSFQVVERYQKLVASNLTSLLMLTNFIWNIVINHFCRV